jgi:hypothetical protein
MAESVYDPKKVTIDFGGFQFSGYAKGSFIRVTRNEDGVKLDIGSDGEHVITRNQNRSGTIRLTLQQDSDGNDYLSAKAALFEADGGGIEPLIVKDLHGTTLHHAEVAWVRKYAEWEGSNEATNREWMFETPDLTMFVGGA